MTDQPDEHAPSPHAEADAEPAEAFHDEAYPHDVPDDVLDDEPAPRTESTGHPAVDEVLRSLEGLDGRPVDEHVVAFEQAHDVLRRALSHAGDDTVARPED